MSQKAFLSAFMIAFLFIAVNGLTLRDQKEHNLQSVAHREDQLANQSEQEEDSNNPGSGFKTWLQSQQGIKKSQQEHSPLSEEDVKQIRKFFQTMPEDIGVFIPDDRQDVFQCLDELDHEEMLKFNNIVLDEIDLPNLFVGEDKVIGLSQKQFNKVMKQAKADYDLGPDLVEC